ncbi:MAG TPA: Gfo/Idh/MocA family oxidoreductase [Chloroflexota bacterium]|nr:Gfo/Idh/MocA family oxidoreductase [Chloroflexota bacterium]
MAPLRIALLGAGYAGRIQLEGWRTVPGVEVVGLWNRTAERAHTLGAELGVPVFEDVDALITHPDVDAVDVATAFETHRDLALRAAAAGKHVLCQKPLAPTYEESAAIVDGCRRAGVRLMVNENWRWRPWYRAVRRVLDTRALGTPFWLRLSLRTDATVATPDRPPDRLFAQQPFMRTMNPLIMMEIGPHHFDVVRYLFGDPGGVYARTVKVSPHVAGDDVAAAFLEYPDRTAIVELSWHAIGYTSDRSKRLHPDELLVEGTEASLALRDDGQIHLAHRDGRRETVPVDTENGYRRSWRDALAHFAECLHTGAKFETTGEDNLTTLRLVFDAYESARTGQPVRRGQGSD